MTSTTATSTTPASQRVHHLADDWTLTLLAGPALERIRDVSVPATVPGSVHTDLLAAGLIDDPYLDDNEALTQWIGRCDWRYATAFDWTPGADVSELVFDGLDTVATIRVNGEVIAATGNMHRSYRFDVRARLREGRNDLEVDFASAIKAADAASLELGYRPHVNHHPYNALRKMACSFGWDWGIDTATAGMWRPARLEEWSTARLAAVRPVATIEGSDGVVRVHVEVARVTRRADASGEAGELTVSATVGGVVASARLEAGETTAVLELRVPNADLWWPRGYGDAALYDLGVTLATADGVELAASAHRIGFRTVTFDTTPDAAGTPLTLVVNGQPVFVKGANWIPDDAFPHRVDRARYARRLDQGEFAGLNLIRIWGGGIYESTEFYELCDERGLMVWQDFLLACAAYAEEEPLRSEIEAEAREAVTRLAPHPSLVVWNGNNENLWGHEEWNWKLRLDGKTWGAGYYHELFPAIVAELAPHVPYTPGSPFTPTAGTLAADLDAHPNDPANGSMHIWDLWNQKDFPHYRDYRPRFVAEFGWQAPPTWSTLTRSISDDPLTPESPGMLVHQKAMEGNAKLTDGLIPHLPLPNEMHDWHWAMQLNQANAITTAVEWFRSLAPHCMGSIVWQLNDCWPVTSWAAVDGDERAKPLLYALRAAHAERLVTIQPADPADAPAGLVVAVVNDTAAVWSGSLAVDRLGFDGSVLSTVSLPVTVAARSVTTVAVPAESSTAADATAEFVRASIDDVRGLWFFAEYRDSALDTGRFDASIEPREGGVLLHVTAETLLRDVTVLVDKVDSAASVDRALVTLLPGERVTFDITTDAAPTLEALTAREVLRTANQLVAS